MSAEHMAGSQTSVRYHKSRDGCITCKIRKIKCGEERPACRRCTSTGRKCDGYRNSAKLAPVVGYLRFKQVDEQCLSPTERRALHHFHVATAPALQNLNSLSLWSRTLLQLCRQEDSLKHMVIAISLLDERQSRTTDTVANDDVEYLHHYGKALSLLASRNKPDVWMVLMATLLFCIFEDYQSNRYAAFQHITSGRNILRNYTSERLRHSSKSGSDESPVMQELIQVFWKLERQTWQFDPETLPPRNGLSLADLCRQNVIPESSIPHGYRVESYCEDDFWAINSEFPDPPKSMFYTAPFKSLGHANLALHALRERCVFLKAGTRPPATRFHVVSTITEELNLWLEKLHAFVRSPTKTFLQEDQITISVLRTLHLCLQILSQTSPFQTEMLWDKNFDSIEYILRKLSYTLELTNVDVTPTLWLGATRCRDPAVRRQTIEMLRRTDRKQWSRTGRGELLSRAAQRVMEIEELNLGHISSYSDIPEESRIRVFSLDNDSECLSLRMSFKRFPYDESVAVEWSFIDLSDIFMFQGIDLKLGAALAFDWMALRE